MIPPLDSAALQIRTVGDLSDAVGVIGALCAAVVFMVQFGRSLQLRRSEQRQTQAGLARELLDKLFADGFSRDALRMLDWEKRRYSVGSNVLTISKADVANGLRTTPNRIHDSSVGPPTAGESTVMNFTDEEQYVRDCFERLYDQIDILEHFTQRGLLDFDDLRVPLEYYARKISPRMHNEFLKEYGYHLTQSFLARFGHGQSES
ncbi:MAG: hypothetical protein SFU53_13450 [Terrimicrobiaceae bacterium]|nr:hypothetical protein [Terrimicrobiaceae bacterium]